MSHAQRLQPRRNPLSLTKKPNSAQKELGETHEEVPGPEFRQPRDEPRLALQPAPRERESGKETEGPDGRITRGRGALQPAGTRLRAAGAPLAQRQASSAPRVRDREQEEAPRGPPCGRSGTPAGTCSVRSEGEGRRNEAEIAGDARGTAGTSLAGRPSGAQAGRAPAGAGACPCSRPLAGRAGAAALGTRRNFPSFF